MSPARVFFVNRVYWPSGEATAQLLTDLAEGLAKRGWDVHVIAAGHAASSLNGVTIHRTNTPDHHRGVISRAWSYRRFLHAVKGQLAHLLQPGDRVVALTDPPLLGVAVAEAATRRGAAVIHWIQDIYPEIAMRHFGPVGTTLLGPLQRRRDAAWRGAQACIALGEAMAATILSRGVSPNRVVRLPNWAPRELQASVPSEAVNADRASGRVADRFVVMYSGNFGRVHEFATLLNAAEILQEEPGIQFVLVGRGPRLAEVQAHVRARRLSNVRVLPPVTRESLAASLAAADVHCVTLQPAYTGLVFPSKLAGIFAAGRPALFIGAADDEIAQLLQTTSTGISCETGDARAVADALRHWHRHPSEAATAGMRARRLYGERFTLEIALSQWEDLLQNDAAPNRTS